MYLIVDLTLYWRETWIQMGEKPCNSGTFTG